MVQWQVGTSTTSGNCAWTADPTHKLTVALDTLVNPTTVGDGVAGPMDHFNSSQPYSWLAVQWDGTYTGPTNAAALNAGTIFDTSAFRNSVAGTFGWQLDPAGHTLSLTYTPTPIPEPGTLALAALAGLGWAARRRRARVA